MIKRGPSRLQLAAMVGFTLSVFALLMFFWIAFGGVVPLKPEGYRFKAAFPEASLLVEEADVRLAGVNIGKVKAKELADGGRRTLATIELDSDFAPIPKDTRAILRQKSLLGETYVELSPGKPASGDLSDGGRLADGNVEETVELDEIFEIFDAPTRRDFQAWLHEAGIATAGDYATSFNDALGNLPAFLEDGTDLLRPLDEQEIALRRLVRNTGRTFGAIAREEGQLRGLIVNGNRTFGTLAERDDALAETVAILPTFLRETRATMTRLESFARATDPLATELKRPAADLAPTLRDLADLSPDLEALFRDLDPFIDAADRGVPQARRVVAGAEPVLESVHVLMPELNPILSFLGFNQETLAGFISTGGAALGGEGEGGYAGDSTTEHYLPQVAIIDARSFLLKRRRPPWERGNAYIAPNAYKRAIPLGTIESFDCDPAGGQVRNPVESEPRGPAPPCFVQPPQLFQRQRFPRLQRGRAPFVPAPAGREGTRPASPNR